MNRPNRSIVKIVALFALGGGVGIPLMFILAWQLMSRVLQGQALIDVMEWFESFRFMFWPTAMFLIYRSGAQAQQWADLLIAVVANIGVYAVVGLCIGLALRHRVAQVAVLVLLVAAMFGLNMYWSHHFASFAAAATLVIVLFLPLLRLCESVGRT